MSSSDAQRSPVHHATEDSNAEPSAGMKQANPTATPTRSDHGRADGGASNFEQGAAMAGRRPDEGDVVPPGQIGAGPGAGDGSSGGGAGAGIPGGGTDMRTNGAFGGGDVEEDRKRLFPEAATRNSGGQDAAAANDPTAADPRDPDESSFGGPLRLNDPDVPDRNS